jgi:hypothetical protein
MGQNDPVIFSSPGQYFGIGLSVESDILNSGHLDVWPHEHHAPYDVTVEILITHQSNHRRALY